MIQLATKKNANRILDFGFLILDCAAKRFRSSGVKRFRFFKSCLLIMMFFCGSDLFAQRLALTDVQAQPVTGPGPGLRIALGGTVNSDMSVAQRDNRDYPQTNINPLFATSVPFNGTISYESIGFNPGFRFDFAPGYRLNQWINFEFETGCIYNTVESYTITGNATPISAEQRSLMQKGTFYKCRSW